jgi:hypothetical protein
MIVICGTAQTACSPWFDADNYDSFNRSFQPFLKILVLCAVTSLTATYILEASPYLTPVVNFI